MHARKEIWTRVLFTFRRRMTITRREKGVTQTEKLEKEKKGSVDAIVSDFKYPSIIDKREKGRQHLNAEG